MCTMHRSTHGGWKSVGDNVKVLATYNDDFRQTTSALNCSFDEPLLICGGSIIKKETFVNLGHFLELPM